MLNGHRNVRTEALIRRLTRCDRDRHPHQIESITRGVILIGPKVDSTNLAEMLEKAFLLIEINGRVHSQRESARGIGSICIEAEIAEGPAIGRGVPVAVLGIVGGPVGADGNVTFVVPAPKGPRTGSRFEWLVAPSKRLIRAARTRWNVLRSFCICWSKSVRKWVIRAWLRRPAV